jgi:hypothetical protein
MKSLSEFAQAKSKWVSMEDGKPYSGIYRGYTYFNKDNNGDLVEYARYLIEDLKDNVVRNLDSASAGLAKQMAPIKQGQTIKLTRTGKGFDTKWKVENMGVTSSSLSSPYNPGMPERQIEEEIPVIEEEPDGIDPENIPF